MLRAFFSCSLRVATVAPIVALAIDHAPASDAGAAVACPCGERYVPCG